MSQPTFTFVGVTTGASAIRAIFPRWMADIGRDVRLVGVDLPLRAEPARYREVVAAIRQDPLALGGLVTTHKIDLLAAARDLFDELDHDAALFGEVSCIARRGAALVGGAIDSAAAGRALEGLLPAGFWRRGGHALCMGAGGAGVAITAYLLRRPDPRERPAQIIVTDRSQERLDALRAVHARLGGDTPVAYVPVADAAAHDALLARLPHGSAVINATGMGKDTPGSPIGDAAPFPRGGLAWELNYRGERPFLRQARAQAAARGLLVDDGWRYFLYGWTLAIEAVLGIALSPARFQRWDALASDARPAPA